MTSTVKLSDSNTSTCLKEFEVPSCITGKQEVRRFTQRGSQIVNHPETKSASIGSVDAGLSPSSFRCSSFKIVYIIIQSDLRDSTNTVTLLSACQILCRGACWDVFGFFSSRSVSLSIIHLCLRTKYGSVQGNCPASGGAKNTVEVVN